jgi:TonB family protein
MLKSKMNSILFTAIAFCLISLAGAGGTAAEEKARDAEHRPHGAAVTKRAAVDLRPYLSGVQRRIMKAWSQPGTRRARTAVVAFKIHADGTESHLRIMKGCGDDAVDGAALKAVNDAAPFEELPRGYPRYLDVELTFHYDILLDGRRQLKTTARVPDVNPQLALVQVGEPSVDFGPYMADLQRRIKRSWFPPRGDETRRVVVVFKVDRDGRLSKLRLDKSSGVTRADQAALKAVENAAPFHHLPEGAPGDVDIQFTFDYNVFGGGKAASRARSGQSGETGSIRVEEESTSDPRERAVELNNEGVRAINKHDLDLAITRLEQAVQLDPEYQLARENLSIAHNNYGIKLEKKPREAYKAFRRALYVDLDNDTARANLERTFEYLRKHSADFNDRVKMGDRAELDGDIEGAIVEYREALRKKEDVAVRIKLNKVMGKAPAGSTVAHSRAELGSPQVPVAGIEHPIRVTNLEDVFNLGSALIIVLLVVGAAFVAAGLRRIAVQRDIENSRLLVGVLTVFLIALPAAAVILRLTSAESLVTNLAASGWLLPTIIGPSIGVIISVTAVPRGYRQLLIVGEACLLLGLAGPTQLFLFTDWLGQLSP